MHHKMIYRKIMHNKIIIVLLIFVVIVCISYYPIFSAEYFTNNHTNITYNILENGCFQNGKLVKGNCQTTTLVGNSQITQHSNPCSPFSKYVLELSGKTTDKFTALIIPLQLNAGMYSLEYQITPSQFEAHDIYIKSKDDRECKLSAEYNQKTITLEKSTVDGVEWFKKRITWTNNNTTLYLYIGCSISEPSLITGLRLLPFVELEEKFTYTIGLCSYWNTFNSASYSGNGPIWTDLYGNNNFRWSKSPLFDNSFQIYNNYSTTPVFNFNTKSQFTISILAKSINNANDNTNNSILYIPGNQGTAFDISLPSNNGPIIVNIGGNKYLTPSINSQTLNLYTFVFNNRKLKIYINDYLLHTISPTLNVYISSVENNNNIVINREMKLNYNLYSLLIYNTQLDNNIISGLYDYFTKLINGVVIEVNPIQPQPQPQNININNGGNKHNTNNRNKKSDYCPIVYMVDGSYVVYIPEQSKYAKKFHGSGQQNYGKNKDNAREIYKKNFPDCPIPDLLRYHGAAPDKCPFIIGRDNPCHRFECRDVDWNANKPAMNQSCKQSIVQYCTINSELDPRCICWRPDMRTNPKCQKFRRYFQNPEDYGCTINTFNIEEHPDMNKYIRKDRIPCWGCNL